ncbi:hypothetical protein Tco_0747669 [Tanacetum coccineum]|uniref:Uncharacterized protein n=1 Tax=Tanacetum coccineum TaxID=301880 RepID=A0ABQ4YWV9_9ASTR
MTGHLFRNRMFPDIEAKLLVKLRDVIDIFDKMRNRSLVLKDNDVGTIGTLESRLLVLEGDARTDISKITRKPSKTSKHGHEERKSTKEAKDSEAKPRKVNS